MSDFNIRRGLSTVLFSAPGVINEKLIIEEGCWYLCTDTAELFLGVLENNTLKLKKINKEDYTEADIPTKLSELLNDCGFITEIPDNYIVEEDLTNFATKEFVTSEIAKAELSGKDIDLSAYYTKSEVDTTIAEVNSNKADKSELFSKDYNDLLNKPNIPSTEGLATEEFVTEAINNIPEVDLSNYVTKSELPSLEDYAKIEDIPDVSIYAEKSEIPDLTPYAKKSEVITAIPDEYITNDELNSHGYATETFVADKIAEAKLEGESVDLSKYATKEDISEFIKEIPFEYITEEELNAKGYLTSHQDISGKADLEHRHDDLYDAKGSAEQVKNELLNGAGEAFDTLKELGDLISGSQNAINALETIAANKADKEHTHSEYLTEHQSLDEYAKKTEIPDVADFITIQDVEAKKYLTDIPAEYITETELNAKKYLTEHQSLAGYATEKFVSDAIADIDIPEVDTSSFATNEELLKKADKVLFTVDKVVTKPVGSFIEGESVKGLTIAEILAKLLGLVDKVVDPDEPEIPEEPTSVVENIIENLIPMYSINSDSELAEITYNYINLTEDEAKNIATESGFYQIKDSSGNVIESGYQELQVDNDSVYYIIALPKGIDFNTMVEVSAYDKNKNMWAPTLNFNLTSDPEVVAERCDEVGLEISHINTDIYTVWAYDDVPTGSILRFKIIENVNK
jgi:hypothetical protein